MIDVGLMIEGQLGVTFPRWQRIAETAESAGFAGLYRSDHFTDAEGPHLDALELWTSLTWLALNTNRLAFGAVVYSGLLRDPRIAAWQAAAINQFAPGRLRLGLGAGSERREHREFGFACSDIDGAIPAVPRGPRGRNSISSIRRDRPRSRASSTARRRRVMPNPVRQGRSRS